MHHRRMTAHRLRKPMLLLLLPVAIAITVYIATLLRHPEPDGGITVEFDGWRTVTAPGNMALIVRNGTRHSLSISEVIASNAAITSSTLTLPRAGAGPTASRRVFSGFAPQLPIRLSRPDGSPLQEIPPGATCEVYVDGFPHSGVAEVYFAPWSSAKAKEAAAREAQRPSWLARWIRPQKPKKVSVKVNPPRPYSF